MSAFPYKIVDLTHTISSEVPYWDGSCGFNHSKVVDHTDFEPENPYKFRAHKMTLNGGIGTHMDSPSHCFPEGKCIHELDLDNLVAPCAVIDISEVADETYKLSAEDVIQFEEEHGQIESGTFVIARTGWEKHWSDREKYRNDLLFPSISEEAAQLLMDRSIVGLGIDTLSPDSGGKEFPVHRLLLGSGRYIVENIANSAQLPPKGSFTLALPLKIKDGSESPIRLIGLTAIL